MRAVRWHARQDVRLEDLPDPGEPSRGEVVLKVRLCGVCGTDLEEYRHGPVTIPTDAPHPLTGRRAPLVLGHEVVASVAALGEDVSGVEVGDRVVPDGLFTCGECVDCRRGARLYCARSAFIGLHTDGGLAEYLTVPAAMCVPVPPAVPDRLAVLTEPLAVAVRAVRRAAPAAGERVVVIGAGPIGQCVFQLASMTRAAVSVLDANTDRLAATPDLTSGYSTAPSTVGFEPADCVLDCAGSAESLALALRLARPGGRVTLVGAAARAPDFSPHDLLVRELTLLTTFSHDLDRDTRAALRLLADGRVRLDHVVTDVVPLADAVEQAFRRPRSRGFKTVVQPP